MDILSALLVILAVGFTVGLVTQVIRWRKSERADARRRNRRG